MDIEDKTEKDSLLWKKLRDSQEIIKSMRPLRAWKQSELIKEGLEALENHISLVKFDLETSKTSQGMVCSYNCIY